MAVRPPTRHAPVLVRVLALIFVAMGIVLIGGGIWLAALGGSTYYALAGAGLAFSGSLIWRGRVWGAWVYFGIAAGTIVWALWEVGFDGWALVTAGGLVFVAAATDNLIRAINITTGETVWQDILPAGGQATPMSYSVGGRQYLAIMAGGHHFMRTPIGDALVVYALPKR